jgi:hypothetical protein
MADERRRGPWTVRSSRRVYDNPWISVIEHDVLRPSGNPGIYGVCSEETGLSAANWHEFLRTDFSNAVTDEIGFGFLAWDLSPGDTDPDDGEMLEIRRLPFAEALDMVLDGQIRDAFSMMMLMKVDALGHRGRLPAAVARLLGYPH